MSRHRRLVIVCGDQLDRDAAVFDGFDPARDAVVMTEAREEATYLRQHKKRLVLFFSAMRHFADDLRGRGWTVHYHALDGEQPAESIWTGAERYEAEEVHATRPGDWRVEQALQQRFPAIRLHEDRHFLYTPDEFATFREGRKRLVMEDFYRHMRKRTGWLMDGEQPTGGEWNYDRQNRQAFGRDGPGEVPGRPHSDPDETTRAVMQMVEQRFPDHPGSTAGFAEPVTRRSALAHLDDFVKNRLPGFGDHQDAMAPGHPTLWHSRLSVCLNLKMLDPREVCARAIEAYENGQAPLNAVEGFVRQILGWREFIRGVYFTEMPGYAERNALDADAPLPPFYWTGETDMACMADCTGQLVQHAYAHHIQRLMVMGLFALLWGAHPYRFHEWHMEMYLDSIDWVSLPNTLGMSQHADGGLVGTKPYTASGNYINRMSSYCRGCRYDPRQATGDDACPFTTLYWDFLARHRRRFAGNRRMKMQYANLDRKDEEMPEIRRRAQALRQGLG